MKPNGPKTYAKGSKHPEIDLVLYQKRGEIRIMSCKCIEYSYLNINTYQ